MMKRWWKNVRLAVNIWLAITLWQANVRVTEERLITENDLKSYRERVVQMFQHAYNGYLTNAYPYDELRPLSCDGADTWGSFSLTLIDALDTLAVMGNFSEFRRVVERIISTANFNTNINVSVFETNIRVVGGLLSAHLLSTKAGLEVEPGWPCSGPLLRLAENIARRLLPAFQTSTGMPYGTVNLRYGVPPGETPITCTAGVSTFIIEFGTLSQLTGDPVFEETALKALDALWKKRSSIGLVGNHINVQEGKWTALDAGIGAGVDSYFEYLVKGAILLQKPELMKMFNEYYKVIMKYMERDDWFMWVSMGSGQVTLPIFQSLEAFWPGLLSLIGNIEQALKTLYNYHQVWKQYGFTPEFYDIVRNQVHNRREGYPLRPELIESVMYLYQATRDPHLLEIGVDILESIQHSTYTECGYATIKNVQDHRVEDRMESFFLAETTKYLYLLFDPTNFIHGNGSCGEVIQTAGGECIIGAGGYIFNTEAHPIDSSAVYCCSTKKKEQDDLLYKFQNSLDLLSVLDISDKNDFLKVFKTPRKKRTSPNKFKSDLNQNSEINSSPESPDAVSRNNSDSTSIVDNLQPVFLDHVNDHGINLTIPTNGTFHDKQNVSTESPSMTIQPIIPSVSDTLIGNGINADSNADGNNSSINSNHLNLEDQVDESERKLETENMPLQHSKQDVNVLKSPLSNSIKVIPVSPAIPNMKPSEREPSHSKPYSEPDYELLSCPAQPFLARISLMGEMFNID